jgi:hypothetical protein
MNEKQYKRFGAQSKQPSKISSPHLRYSTGGSGEFLSSEGKESNLCSGKKGKKGGFGSVAEAGLPTGYRAVMDTEGDRVLGGSRC